LRLGTLRDQKQQRDQEKPEVKTQQTPPAR
jgi:hypothetical protein